MLPFIIGGIAALGSAITGAIGATAAGVSALGASAVAGATAAGVGAIGAVGVGAAVAAGLVAITVAGILTVEKIKNWLKRKKEEQGKDKLEGKITECLKKGDYNPINCGLNETNQVNFEVEDVTVSFKSDDGISPDIHKGLMISA